MPRRSTGTVYKQGDVFVVRITLGKARPVFPMPTCGTRAQADERGTLVAETAARLRAGGHHAVAEALLERLAAAALGKEFDTITVAIARVLSGEVVSSPRTSTTFQEFGEAWTSGRLHAEWKDQIKLKSSADDDAGRLNKHVYPLIGHLALRDFANEKFALDHADSVMRALPSELASSSRRHVAQLIRRILQMAVYPARIIPAQPLPRGFLPPISDAKAKGHLYPSEDAELLACTDIPLADRVFYGFSNREGMRLSEAERLEWGDLDLARGGVALDVNKTDQPRAWALSPGVTRALALWWVARGRPGPRTRVFEVEPRNAARTFRAHLKAAGIARPQLFERSSTRQPIRVHDLRATFITVSLANGKTETWVMDRTGHTTSAMINKYRRAARALHELGAGDFVPLIDALPDLRRLLPEPNESSAESSEVEVVSAAPRAALCANPTEGEAGTRGRGRTGTPSLIADFESEERVASIGKPLDCEGSGATFQPVHDAADRSLTIPDLRAHVLRTLEELADLALRAGDDTIERTLRATLARVANGRVEGDAR